MIRAMSCAKVRGLPLQALATIAALTCVSVGFACQTSGSSYASPSARSTHDPGNVECPDGKSARNGLANYGAYIGTWQSNRRHDTATPSDYVIGSIPGHVAVRCSSDDYVIVEEIHPLFQSPAGQALRVALTELPDDSEKVYDHRHAGCRVLQYRSQKLADQLGADDNDGRVDIVFESEGSAYNAGAIKVILMDLFDSLGADTRDC